MDKTFLLSEQSIAFTTRDFALALGLSLSAASHRLALLHKSNSIIRLTRGVWANTKHPFFSPLSCIPILLGAEQGYLSFLSVLHQQGMLSQIPATMQIATTGRGRKLRTAVGTFEFFQLKPQLMKEGVAWSQSRIPYRIASAEKAFFDTIYLATRKGRRFKSLPELDFESSNFSRRRFLALIKRADISLRLRNAVTARVMLSSLL